MKIPKNVHMIVATKGEMLNNLQRIAECRLRVVGNNMVSTIDIKRYLNVRSACELSSQVEIVVSERNAKSLPELESKYNILLSQLVRQYTYFWVLISTYIQSVSNRSRVVLYSSRWCGTMPNRWLTPV